MAEPGPASVGDPPAPRGRRRSFGPVVLLGLAGAAVTAVAGHERWVSAQSCGRGAVADLSDGGGVGEAPAAGAVALVLLAAWGVLLVTRGRVRRAVSVVIALAAVGLVVAVALGPRSARGSVTDYLDRFATQCSSTGLTGWFWVALVGALIALGPALLAVRLVPAWPEMGSRYDAPTDSATRAPETSGPVGAAPLEERESLELWKAMDEGDDPTA